MSMEIELPNDWLNKTLQDASTEVNSWSEEIKSLLSQPEHLEAT